MTTGRFSEFQQCLLGRRCWKSSRRSGAQGEGSCWFCMRLSAAAAMVLRLSTVKSSSGATSSSRLGKSWSSSLLFRNLLRTRSQQLVVLFTKSRVCYGVEFRHTTFSMMRSITQSHYWTNIKWPKNHVGFCDLLCPQLMPSNSQQPETTTKKHSHPPSPLSPSIWTQPAKMTLIC